MAPSASGSDVSGTTNTGSNSSRVPRPPQRGQAPWGLLNEKVRGAISGNEMPQSAQALRS